MMLKIIWNESMLISMYMLALLINERICRNMMCVRKELILPLYAYSYVFQKQNC